MNATEPESSRKSGVSAGWLDMVRQQVASLRYGVVQIVVHDSQVAQIEKTERFRLEKARRKTFRAARKLEANSTNKRNAHRTSGG